MAGRDWSMGSHEPYWRPNSSFSPPPSRWDFRFQSEGLPYGDDGVQFYGSTSLNNKESQSWVSDNVHQYSTSGGAGPFPSNLSDLSQGPQWTPPTTQEININDYETAATRDPILRQPSLAPVMEGMSASADYGVSNSSRSDSTGSEPNMRPCLSSHHNFSSKRYFMSKPIHPLSFPMETPREASEAAAARFSDFDVTTPQRDAHSWSSTNSSLDFADVTESFESESFGGIFSPSDGIKCGLCERLLSQRSPWSCRRLLRGGDMPVVGVLSCHHVFHAECLEQTTPKTWKSDPPCLLCARSEDETSPEQQGFSWPRNNFPRLRPFCEGGPSRPWGCVQVGDCVEDALYAPPRNTMLLLNRSRTKKNISLKGKEFPGKSRKTGSPAMQLSSGKSVDCNVVGGSQDNSRS
ncbi:uncharacterized protein LOC110825809 isoform X2 [Carica papaya]|uniref:uncharacterized protein LOC110825809 isoform X2 n=1 Tax=Carica papaya TaxID=3649 RepID=UPI000B8D1A15|nr:uncharacterized protein LOC110825809 isoform X2 [Carica papaya]